MEKSKVFNKTVCEWIGINNLTYLWLIYIRNITYIIHTYMKYIYKYTLLYSGIYSKIEDSWRILWHFKPVSMKLYPCERVDKNLKSKKNKNIFH